MIRSVFLEQGIWGFMHSWMSPEESRRHQLVRPQHDPHARMKLGTAAGPGRARCSIAIWIAERQFDGLVTIGSMRRPYASAASGNHIRCSSIYYSIATLFGRDGALFIGHMLSDIGISLAPVENLSNGRHPCKTLVSVPALSSEPRTGSYDLSSCKHWPRGSVSLRSSADDALH
jgi:hypothetical protein